MQKLLVYITLLLVLCGVAFLLWSRAPRIPDVTSATSTATGAQMSVKEFSEDTEAYSIEARYPQFGIASADAAIQRRIDAAVSAFKTYPADVPSVDSVPKNEQLITFNETYIGSDYISVALEVSEYTGGAHPNSVTIGVNVDARAGKEVSLEEALALIGRSLTAVASETDAQLRAELADAYFEEGAAATPGNYSTFVIRKDSVTFIFNSYQVAPYAAGPQSVTFSRI